MSFTFSYDRTAKEGPGARCSKKMEVFGPLVWRVDIQSGGGGQKQECSLQACMEKGK